MNEVHGLESMGILLLKPPGSGYVVVALSMLVRTADTKGEELPSSGSCGPGEDCAGDNDEVPAAAQCGHRSKAKPDDAAHVAGLGDPGVRIDAWIHRGGLFGLT